MQKNVSVMLLWWCQGTLWPGPRASLTQDERVERTTKIPPGNRRCAIWATVVELSAVREPSIAIEHEEVRRAGSAKRFGDLLTLVMEIREREAATAGPFDRSWDFRSTKIFPRRIWTR